MSKYMGTTKYVRPKIYCQSCKWFKSIYHPIGNNEIGVRCLNSFNNKKESDWRKEWSNYINKPEQSNKYNNCKYYKRKWWKI